MKNPLVSVIVPTYNRADFIGSTIDSILNQTYENIELIVVSDGSTDNTDSALAEYEQRNERLKYISLAQNTGIPAKVRNTGVKHAKGEYIAFCDDDDVWEENKLELQIEMLEKTNGDMSFTTISLFNEDKEYAPSKLSYITASVSNQLLNNGFNSIILFGSHIVNSSVVLKRDVFDKHGFLNEDKTLRASEDIEYWIRIIPSSKLCYIAKPLVKYRVHPRQISTNRLAAYQRFHRVISEAKGYPKLSLKLAKNFIQYRIENYD